MKCENCLLYGNCSKRKTLKKKPWKMIVCSNYKPIHKKRLPPWIKDL